MQLALSWTGKPRSTDEPPVLLAAFSPTCSCCAALGLGEAVSTTHAAEARVAGSLAMLPVRV